MTTMISVESVTTDAKEILITGKDIESILMEQGNLDAEFREVTFHFSRSKKNEMAYMFKVVSKSSKDAKSPQEMLNNLVGAIITLNDSFKVKA